MISGVVRGNEQIQRGNANGHRTLEAAERETHKKQAQEASAVVEKKVLYYPCFELSLSGT